MAPISFASSLITPIEPDRASRQSAGSDGSRISEAVYADALRRLEVSVASSCGLNHGVNEDAHSPLGGAGRMFVVADGVGGGALAQLASRLLVAHLHQALEAQPPDAGRVDDAVLDADRAIAAAIARVTDQPGAATVVLCAALDGFAAQWLVAWVGDCRGYRWSPHGTGRLDPLTRDDTFAHLGETAPPGGSADDPARMVGNGATSGASSAIHALAPGELLALCSDGVHKHLDDADWCRLLAQPLALAQRGANLVALARAHGSVDDATVLLIARSEPAARPPRRSGRPGAPPNFLRSRP